MDLSYIRSSEMCESFSRWLCVALLALLVELPGCAAGNSGADETEPSSLATQPLDQALDPNLLGQPLNANELIQLKQGLSIVHFGEYEAAIQAMKYKGRPIVSDLSKIISDEKELFQNRISAIWLLGKTGDPLGQPVLKAIIDQSLPVVVTNEQYQLLRNALLCFGMFGDGESLDFLEKEAATEAYWVGRNAESATGNDTPQEFRRSVRLNAFWGIALSGSQRAIKLFESPEGMPEEFHSERESLLKAARMRNLGYIRVEDYDAREK